MVRGVPRVVAEIDASLQQEELVMSKLSWRQFVRQSARVGNSAAKLVALCQGRTPFETQRTLLRQRTQGNITADECDSRIEAVKNVKSAWMEGDHPDVTYDGKDWHRLIGGGHVRVCHTENVGAW